MLAAVAVLGAAAAVAPVLRTPDERVEGRVTDALEAAGVELADPVDLESSGGEAPVWTGRVRVVQADGSVAGVRVSVRPDGPSADAIPARWLFPGVDCDSPYPLSWLGDSDSSYRTTRAQLAECLSQDRRGDVLVTIAWRRAEFDPGAPDGGTGAEAAGAADGANGSTDGADGSTDGSGSRPSGARPGTSTPAAASCGCTTAAEAPGGPPAG